MNFLWCVCLTAREPSLEWRDPVPRRPQDHVGREPAHHFQRVPSPHHRLELHEPVQPACPDGGLHQQLRRPVQPRHLQRVRHGRLSVRTLPHPTHADTNGSKLEGNAKPHQTERRILQPRHVIRELHDWRGKIKKHSRVFYILYYFQLKCIRCLIGLHLSISPFSLETPPISE